MWSTPALFEIIWRYTNKIEQCLDKCKCSNKKVICLKSKSSLKSWLPFKVKSSLLSVVVRQVSSPQICNLCQDMSVEFLTSGNDKPSKNPPSSEHTSQRPFFLLLTFILRLFFFKEDAKMSVTEKQERVQL